MQASSHTPRTCLLEIVRTRTPLGNMRTNGVRSLDAFLRGVRSQVHRLQRETGWSPAAVRPWTSNSMGVCERGTQLVAKCFIGMPTVE
jgi:hypothetical protein